MDDETRERFDKMDERFKELYEYLDIKFTEVNKRFSEVDQRFLIMSGAIAESRLELLREIRKERELQKGY